MRFLKFWRKNDVKLSIDEQLRILNDRVEFKLWASQRHINNLKNIEKRYGHLNKIEAQVYAEYEIDTLFAEIMGALDSLLFMINEKLNLGILDDYVWLNTVQGELNKIGKSDLLRDVHQVNNKGGWLWALRKKRNYSMHNRMVYKEIVVVDGQISQYRFFNNPYDRNDGKEDKDIIPYLEKSLQNMRKLIEGIRQKEPTLK